MGPIAYFIAILLSGLDAKACSIEAVVTDPPYGVVEYTEEQLRKRKTGKGGIWRIPPSFDGCQRAPLPRFTVLTDIEKRQLREFFVQLSSRFDASVGSRRSRFHCH